MCYIGCMEGYKVMRKRAFTLIELLIVLLILGVLTGIAVPRYMESTKTAKRVTFETNLQDIVKALEDYKIQHQFENTLYPTSLEQLQNSNTFNKEPVNPYTGKSMLSSNSEESGLQYQAMGGKYKLCVVQRDIEDVNNNGIVDEVLPLVTKTTCIGDTTSNIGVEFKRNSVAYTSNGIQVGIDMPRYEASKFGQGKFGKAIMLEEGTTNLFSAEGSSFEGGTIGNWTTVTANAVIITGGWHGAKAVQVTATASNGRMQQRIDGTLVNLNDTVTLSAYAKLPNGAAPMDVMLAIAIDGAPRDARVAKQITSDKWTRLSVTTTLDTLGSGVYAQLFAGSLYSDTYGTVIWDAIQLEKKPYATSWTVGTRQPEILKIPTNIVTPTVGTVSVWVNVNDLIKRKIAGINKHIFYFSNAQGENIHLFHYGTSTNWRFSITAGGTQKDIYVSETYTPNGWHHFVATWSSSKMALYIDGIKRGEVANPTLPQSITQAFIGGTGSSTSIADTVLDDFVIYNRQLSDNEVQAIYSSNQPAPITENTTYALRFDGGLNFGRGGYYISPEYDLSTVGNYVKHRVYWQEDADKEECLVYAKLDNQSDWTQLTNGGSLPIVEGQDLTGRKIQFKVKLLDLV